MTTRKLGSRLMEAFFILGAMVGLLFVYSAPAADAQDDCPVIFDHPYGAGEYQGEYCYWSDCVTCMDMCCVN